MNHLEATLGTNPATCGSDHDYANVYGVTSNFHLENPGLRVKGLNYLDWDWAISKFGITSENTGLMTCMDCMDDKPSRLEKIANNAARNSQPPTPAHAELSDDLVHCSDCDTDFNADETVEVRYCTFCEITFNGTDNGRNCEDCNRPFTRKCSDNGCPECLSEENECEAVS